MMLRLQRVMVPAVWGAFLSWLLLSGEVDRYIGPRTQWVVVVGAIALCAVAAASCLGRVEAGTGTAVGIVIMLVPVVAVIAIPKPSLGSLAASRKLSGGAIASIQLPPADGEISFPDIEYASESTEYAAATGIVSGLEIELTGFVTHRDDGPATFALTRFSIFCCAADVVPYSVDVLADRDYPDDRWLTVRGRLEERGNRFIVVADAVREVSEPDDPYLR